MTIFCDTNIVLEFLQERKLVDEVRRIIAHAISSGDDLFISIGTSGVVYPAAGFVSTAHRYNIPTVEFNLEPSATKGFFDYGIYGKAGTTLPKFVDRLLECNGDLNQLF